MSLTQPHNLIRWLGATIVGWSVLIYALWNAPHHIAIMVPLMAGGVALLQGMVLVSALSLAVARRWMLSSGIISGTLTAALVFVPSGSQVVEQNGGWLLVEVILLNLALGMGQAWALRSTRLEVGLWTVIPLTALVAATLVVLLTALPVYMFIPFFQTEIGHDALLMWQVFTFPLWFGLLEAWALTFILRPATILYTKGQIVAHTTL